MATTLTTLTANTAGTVIGYMQRNQSATEYVATLAAYGTFGGGTLSYAISPNGGTTLITLKTSAGSAYSTTSNDLIEYRGGTPTPYAPQSQGQEALYAVLTGATSPNINIKVMDNQ